MKAQNHYDFIVYGATLEGVLTGNYLHQKGFKTLILEPSDRIGQYIASVVPSNGQEIPSVFTNLPSDDETLKLISWLRDHLKLPSTEIYATQSNLPPVTFEKGTFEPFVGFGENAPKETEFLQSFSFANRIELTPSINEWLHLAQNSGVQIQFNSTLTNIAIEDSKVARITINGSKDYTAENYLFCQNPANLVTFLDPANTENKGVSQKLISRLSKPEHWSLLQLSVAHKEVVSDRREIHFLYGTQKSPIVSIGQFFEKSSQWISFISPDVIDINQEGVQVIKEMKRQIKRAHPEAFNDVAFEKIALWPQTHGFIDLKSKHFGELEGIENLGVCSNHIINEANPLLGALIACKNTMELISGLTDPAELRTADSENTAARY